MATGNGTGLVIKPIGNMVQALSRFGQSLYKPPPDTIRGIDSADWYSPLQPIIPFAPEGSEPKGFQYWSGQNLIWTPRADSAYTAADLKGLATYPLARICIENVKDAVTRCSWEIQLRAKPGETRRDTAGRARGDDNLLKLNRFFEYPDREHNWQDWLRPLLDDLLVIDAGSILMRRTFPTKSNPNGTIAELAVIRGEMITRYIDENGFTPLPPSPAYSQNWWGMPYLNLTTDQLVYKPRNIVPRNTVSSNLYGMSPTEQLAPEIEVGIERLKFVLAYYKEGSVPGVVQVVPRGTPIARIEEAMQWMNSELAGNLAARNQWRMIQGFNEPGKNDQIEYTKEPLLAGVYDEKHIREVAFGYGTSPQRLMKMIRTEGKASSDSAETEGTLPWILWVKGVVDYIIQVKMGFTEYEFAIDPFSEPDPLKNAAGITMLVSKGAITPNEARERLGEDLRPEPEADQLGIITGTGFVPLGMAPALGGVDVDDQGNTSLNEHADTPVNNPRGGATGRNSGGSNRGSRPSQAAGGGRSVGRHTPTGKTTGQASLARFLDVQEAYQNNLKKTVKATAVETPKKKLSKRIGSRIDPDVLSPQSKQAVQHIGSTLHKVFMRQHDRAQIAADRLIKTQGSLLHKRKFQSIQFNLSPEDAQKVLDVPVMDSDFFDKGRDKQPHITVLFGLHKEVTPEDANKITAGIGAIEVMALGLEAFPDSGDGEPLVMRVESEQLQKLHDDLSALDHTSTHPDYKPHITIGYLKPGAGKQYVDLGNPLEGETFVLSKLVFSNIDKVQIELTKKYSSVSEVPSYVPKSKRKQWLDVFNSEWDRHKDSSQEERERIAFSAANGVAGPNAKKAYAALLQKASDDEQQAAIDAIVDEMEKEWRTVPVEIRDYLANSSLSGVGQGMLQIDYSSAAMISSANNVAQDYAINRAAELVGMKYDDEGNLIPNPNAKWAISDTTRNKIRDVVTEAFGKDTPIQDVKDAIQKALRKEAQGGIFSEARATMIARTETMNAQVRGNFDVWQKSGIVETVKWLTTEDEKVCEECDSNDGKVVHLGSAFPSGAKMPTEHPYCRCVLVVESVSE